MSRASARNYRQTEAYRLSRQAYEQRPEVQMRNGIKRAMKNHETPLTPQFHAPKPPRTPKVK